jgi:DNA-binding response OmpR family regulator
MDKFRILLIDDEEELVATLVERLEMRDIEAEYVMTGPDALRRLSEKSFDAALLDYKLPGMSGMEVMRRIEKQFPGVKVLLITGAGSVDGEEEEIPPEKAADVLLKPIDIEVLIEKLRAAVRGK